MNNNSNGNNSAIYDFYCRSIPEWIDGNFVNSEVIGTQSDTSQVHPKLLTDALLNAAKTKGAKVVMDEVKDIEITENNKITGESTLLG